MVGPRGIAGLATAALTAALAFGSVAVAGPVAKKSANPIAQNGRIVFTSTRSGSFDNEDVFVMNADGSNPVDITPSTTGGGDDVPRFSPDGKRIVFDSDRSDSDGDVWVMNADGSNPVNLTPDNPNFDG
jgi:dipeptidyl aminopeptidase/acylaminoacyl peptidase